MMPAAKMFDPILGIDIHMIQPPPPVPPLPIPHPHIAIAFDPMDLVPVIGATVSVFGLPRVQAGSEGLSIPHFPIGGMFVKPPGNECEAFMGSATVSVDCDAFSYMLLPVLTCQDFGLPGPPRPKGSPPTSLVLPLGLLLSIPLPVLVGGPPTVSLMALGLRAFMRLAGPLLKALGKKFLDKFKALRKKLFKNMDSGFLKCKILRAEPVNAVTGAVHVEQEDFSLPGRVPLSWTRSYQSDRAEPGLLGRGWRCLADARLFLDEDGDWAFHSGGNGTLYFPGLPERPGEAPVLAVGGHAEARRLSAEAMEIRPKDGPWMRLRRQDPGLWRVEALTDSLGNGWTFDWSGERLLGLRDEGGRRVHIEVRGGRLHSLSLEHPDFTEQTPLVRYQHDGERLSAALDPHGLPYSFAYDRQGRLVQHTSRTGLSFYYAYEPNGDRVVHAWGDGGLYDYRFEYTEGQTRIIAADGGVSTLLIENFLPLREIDPLGGVTEYEYDEDGHTTAVTLPNGACTRYTYDPRGDLIQTADPTSAVTTLSRDAEGRIIAVTDPLGGRWQQRWGAQERVIAQLDPLGHETRYDYGPQGDLLAIIDALGHRTQLEHDRFGLLVGVEDALGARTLRSLGPRGEPLTQTDALGRTLRWRWDQKGRLLGAISATGLHTQFVWDADDRLVEQIEPNGDRTRLEYSGISAISAKHLPDGSTVRYAYDGEERLLSLQNPRGEVWRFTRDPLGRVVQEQDYWGHSQQLRYDPAGQLSERIDPLGRRLLLRRDPAGRVTHIEDESGRAESLGYDPLGRLVTASSPEVSSTRSYDAAGRLVEEVFGELRFRQAYDAVGNPIRRESSLGHEVHYTYDARDDLSAVTVNGHTLTFRRDTLGRVTEEGSGALHRLFRWDDEDRLSQREVRGVGSILLHRYGYDERSNLIERQVVDESGKWRSQRFFYDPCGRVTREMDPEGRVRSFMRDPAGDLMTLRADGSEREGVYEGNRYRFDAAGNLASRTLDGETQELRWDAWQRLTRFTKPGVLAEYGYDPLSRRAWKDVNGQRTQYAWLGEQLLAEQGPQGAREWVYQPGSFIPLAQIDPEGVRWLGTDLNGAVSEVHDAEGALLSRSAPSSSGEIQGLRATCPLRGQGQIEDPESGLYYNRHRYYDPRIEQFVSVDPLGIAPDENVYRMGPNVWGWVDPGGLTFYRGVKPGEPAVFARPNDIKVKDGMVQNTRGPSVFDSKQPVLDSGRPAFILDESSVPDSLKIEQKGRPGHYEIMPRQPMPEADYHKALKEIKVLPC